MRAGAGAALPQPRALIPGQKQQEVQNNFPGPSGQLLLVSCIRPPSAPHSRPPDPSVPPRQRSLPGAERSGPPLPGKLGGRAERRLRGRRLRGQRGRAAVIRVLDTPKGTDRLLRQHLGQLPMLSAGSLGWDRLGPL